MNKYPVRIFHHMPKCGGTAVRKVLGGWFNVIMDYITVEQLRGEAPLSPPVNLLELNSNDCVCSHFEMQKNHLFIRYPEVLIHPELFQAFSLVRDPLGLRISLYYYEIKAGRRYAKTQSLSEYLQIGQNYLAQRFACNEENYLEILGRYTFIGVQERLQESIEALANIFKRPVITLDQSNVATRDGQSDALSQDVISEFVKSNKLDYLIYESVIRKF